MIKTEREIWPSLPSHYVLIRLSHLSQVGPAALQILNGLFGLPHEVLGLTRVSTLQYTDTTPREGIQKTEWAHLEYRCLLSLLCFRLNYFHLEVPKNVTTSEKQLLQPTEEDDL